MSTKSSLWWSESGLLYLDLLDTFEGPHAYLRIDAGRVKNFEVSQTTRRLSLTVRLPPEIFPNLRPTFGVELPPPRAHSPGQKRNEQPDDSGHYFPVFPQKGPGLALHGK
jgi:hypothetical protein